MKVFRVGCHCGPVWRVMVALLLPVAAGCAVSRTDVATGGRTILGLARCGLSVATVDRDATYITATRRVPGLHLGLGPGGLGFGFGLDDDQAGWVVPTAATNLIEPPSGGWAMGTGSGGTWRLGLIRFRGVPGGHRRQVLVTGRTAVGIAMYVGGDNSLMLGAGGTHRTLISDDVLLEATASKPPEIFPEIDRTIFSSLPTETPNQTSKP